ncbi:MAG TPA: stage III sporulation protein AG [Candidatus Eubacterium avistercoris]|uniref:Stage III sporulation protein AG n=1 Tax=Candidatus Eubacterium avistercoris TaxID=2838567 RepID=A0A9D2IFD4_9FIRM|nr:stage III sporulation protein AG [Candidatus Eubacterium avistercoris]
MDIRKFVKEKQWKKWKKDQWLILFLAGVLLLVIAIPVNSGRSGSDKERGSQTQTDGSMAADEKTQTSADDYAGALEEKLEELLSQMEGVGKVRVMITLKDTGESVVEKDTNTTGTSTSETDSGGGKRQITESSLEESTVYQDSAREGEPFIAKENMPEIEGVLVVAQGGGNTVTARNISESLEALFGIEAHKIKVVKMNMQEG